MARRYDDRVEAEIPLEGVVTSPLRLLSRRPAHPDGVPPLRLAPIEDHVHLRVRAEALVQIFVETALVAGDDDEVPIARAQCVLGIVIGRQHLA